MKNAPYIFLLILAVTILSACSSRGNAGGEDLESLYDSVDMEMMRSEMYRNAKERRIDMLRNDLAEERNSMLREHIADRLIAEYESYISDSALRYVNENLAVADDDTRRNRLLIKKADITSHAGLFPDALAILNSINVADLDSATLVDYYSTFCGVYQYQSEYSTTSEYRAEYERLRELYTDSLVAVAPEGSFLSIINAAPSMARAGNIEGAIELMTAYLDNYESGTRSYSIIASILADLYKQAGDMEKYKRFLVFSTISDIRGVVKENMAIRELATILFENGDIERANRYLKQSFADANFFAARMRNAQSSRMLPVIDEAYNAKQHTLRDHLRWLVVAISILVVILCVAFIFIYSQFKRLKLAHAAQKDTNRELSELSSKLAAANEELAEINQRLADSDSVKEHYAGRFMQYCSAAIASLHHYHQSLRILANQGNKAALVRKLESTEIIDSTLKTFYNAFDEAILEFYPDFIRKFNDLLLPEQQVVLKPGELLNTELRVFALIRIGITDSEKIAEFLRCSITTVYTYRSKVRRRAIDPENFEERVRDIL